jgi:hypothetical protein
LSDLAGTTNQAASIIYFGIVNTRSRTTILEKLLQMTHGTKYDVHWHGEPGAPGKPATSGLFALIRQLDEKRNNIVHWHTVIETGSRPDGTPINEESLAPPHFWYRTPEMVPLLTSDLEEFILKAEFVHRSINMFAWFNAQKTPLAPEARQTWPEIFARPAIYPPSNARPLRTRKPASIKEPTPVDLRTAEGRASMAHARAHPPEENHLRRDPRFWRSREEEELPKMKRPLSIGVGP